MVKIDFQFVWINSPWFVLIEIGECFFESFPLKLDFFKDCFFNVHIVELILHNLIVVIMIFNLVFVKVFLELWIFHRIMPKVEALWLMYYASHPLRKVCVAYFAILFNILVLDKFFQVLILKFLCLASKKPNYILNCYVAIIICVQIQKCFSYRDPIVGETVFYIIFKLFQSVFNSILVFLFCFEFQFLDFI